jgi:hypothetical protein
MAEAQHTTSNATKDLDAAQRQSIQSRAHDPRSDLGVGGLLVYMSRAGELVSPWWSTQRDIDLREFWKGSDHMSGSMALLTDKVVNIPVEVQPREIALKSHIKQADQYNQLLLEESEFGLAWPTFISKWLEDWWGTDNGGFMEVIGAGKKDGPIRGPALGLAHLDSTKIVRKKDLDFPVSYIDEDGHQYRLHRSRVAYASSQPSATVEMRGVGFCALSRAINVGQNLVDIATFKQEKLGSRPFRGVMFTPGIPTDVVQSTLEMASEIMDNQGLRRFAKIPILGGEDTDARFELISLSSLPDGFDEETSTRLGMFAIALAFGVPIRWIWPAATSGATKADAMYQHIAGLGGGVGRVLKVLTYMLGGDPRGKKHTIGKFLPPHLKIVFDFQDDEQDRMKAEIQGKRMETVEKALGSGLYTLRTAREQSLEAGDITKAQFETMELAEGRLPSGEDVLTLFYAGEEAVQELLDLGVEDPLDVQANEPEEMLASIEEQMASVRDTISSARSLKQKDDSKQAMAALNKLRDVYQEVLQPEEVPGEDASAQDEAADSEMEDQAQEGKTPTSDEAQEAKPEGKPKEDDEEDEEEEARKKRASDEKGGERENGRGATFLEKALERVEQEARVALEWLRGATPEAPESRYDVKVWSDMSAVPKHLRSMHGARLSLAQVNHLARIAEAVDEDSVESPWAVARAQFQRVYKREDDIWVRRKKTGKKESTIPLRGWK